MILLIVLLATSCSNSNSLFYLTDKYYHEGNYISFQGKSLDNLDSESYLLYTYNNYCNLPIHCEDIFKNVMAKYKIDVVSLPFEEFRKTKFYNDVKYAPSVLIINKGEVVAFLDANSDDDLIKYQDNSAFEMWLSKYIYLENN